MLLLALFGLIQFENGARVMMEMVDTGRTTPAVGDAMRMRFRISVPSSMPNCCTS